MPQLPSGRRVGIHCLTPEDTIKKVSGSLSNINVKTKKSPQKISDELRDKSALSSCPDDKHEWLHQQNVVFANDLFDFYESDVLNGINHEAYGIVKSVALSESSH